MTTGAVPSRLSGLDRRFDAILEDCKISEHGSKQFNDLKELFAETFRRTIDVLEFLQRRTIHRPPVVFEDVPADLWKRHKNHAPQRFPFLQGDLITVSHVVPLVGAGVPDVQYWQVLSRDCDTYKQPWLRVAPVYTVHAGSHGPDGKTDPANIFKQALLFRSPHRFAIPPFDSDEGRGIRGYFSDFSVPYYVSQRHADAAVQIASLTETGWHLFCPVLVASASRLENIAESIALREMPDAGA